MEESNDSDDILHRFIEEHQNCIIPVLSYLVVIENKDQNKLLEQGLIKLCKAKNQSLYIFHSAEECCSFIFSKVANNELMFFSVHVQIDLADTLIPEIVYTEEVQNILVIGGRSITLEERERMKIHPKVSFINDKVDQDIPFHYEKLKNHETARNERLNSTIPFFDICNEISPEAGSLYTGPVDRSGHCSYSTNSLLHCCTLRFLLDTDLSLSNYDQLIKYLVNKLSATQNCIDIPEQEYSANRAIYFYSRYDLIFKELNAALRSLQISNLIAFQFIIKDMYAQLREIMDPELTNQPVTVYRGQMIHLFEILELFNMFEKQVPITITSFFSTTRKRDTAFGFLHGGVGLQQQNTFFIPILFTINIRQEDISSHCPFADVSRYSAYGEEEVLFSPGQSFIINKFEILYESQPFTYSIEVSLYNRMDNTLNAKYMELKHEYETTTNEPLVHLAKMLGVYKKYDESKDIYLRLLEQKIDQATEIACYSGLAQLAVFQKNTKEMMSYISKIEELKFGISYSSACTDEIQLNEEDSRKLKMLFGKLQRLMTNVPMGGSLAQLLNYHTSAEYQEHMHAIPKTAFDLALLLMKSGDYSLAITYFGIALSALRFTTHSSSDCLLKSKCFTKLGHCYCKLKQYDRATENYTLALKNDIPLPMDDYIEIMTATGHTFELSKEFETALSKYIEVAEIYQNKADGTDPNDIILIEERIKQVLSQIFPSDESISLE